MLKIFKVIVKAFLGVRNFIEWCLPKWLLLTHYAKVRRVLAYDNRDYRKRRKEFLKKQNQARLVADTPVVENTGIQHVE